MEKFIVSARKYRPQTFNTVVGQSHITETLKNAITHHQLAHAFLFCGPRGVGKTTCARILAKTINCENQLASGEACNVCTSCKNFNEGTSLNIHELDAASNNSVDDIRTLVEQVRFAPQAGKYKVYIVDEVHMLSASAFNAFLKTLEEPPSYAIFILATTEKHKILPTIISRCQIFDFKRITLHDTVEHLQEIISKEHIQADKAALQVIAQKSEGCLRDALSTLDKIVSFTNGELTYQNTLEHLNILDEDYYFQLMDFISREDAAGALLLYDEINRKGFEGDMVLNGFAEFIRNLLVCKDQKAAALLDVVEGLQERYFAAAKLIEIPFLVSALNVLNEAELNYKMSRNKKLHTELAIIKLCYLQQAIQLASEKNMVAKKSTGSSPGFFELKKLNGNPQKSFESEKKISPGPKLYVETPASAKKVVAEESPVMASGKKNLLTSLREKYGGNYDINEIKDAKALEINALQLVWNRFCEELELQNKHSAATACKQAHLKVLTDNRFQVTVHGRLTEKFMEQEKLLLADTIQQEFNNRSIRFEIIFEGGNEKPEDIPLQYLSSKDKFAYIAEKYPLVLELKQRLHLELDL
ncbi:MAG: DNA polymerase III subunit gamma/tau [Bacteroidetes bacterium]|nr:DNA polymerase III subunit gamma/tau [Bacteroidota bacterium]